MNLHADVIAGAVDLQKYRMPGNQKLNLLGDTLTASTAATWPPGRRPSIIYSSPAVQLHGVDGLLDTTITASNIAIAPTDQRRDGSNTPILLHRLATLLGDTDLSGEALLTDYLAVLTNVRPYHRQLGRRRL